MSVEDIQASIGAELGNFSERHDKLFAAFVEQVRPIVQILRDNEITYGVWGDEGVDVGPSITFAVYKNEADEHSLFVVELDVNGLRVMEGQRRKRDYGTLEEYTRRKLEIPSLPATAPSNRTSEVDEPEIR